MFPDTCMAVCIAQVHMALVDIIRLICHQCCWSHPPTPPLYPHLQAERVLPPVLCSSDGLCLQHVCLLRQAGAEVCVLRGKALDLHRSQEAKERVIKCECPADGRCLGRQADRKVKNAACRLWR